MSESNNPGEPAWRLRRLLKQIHRDNDDELTDADLELLRAYDPREWDSIDEFLEDYFSDEP